MANYHSIYLHNTIKMSIYVNTKSSFPFKTRSNLSRSSRACTAVVAQNHSYWAAIEADIDTYLKKSIAIRSPETVFEPMHHLTFAAPRTAASAICVAACELVGGERSQAIATASAIHIMHAAAYAHEHLPLTDRPRPNSKPAIQHKYGPNIELLTGDGMASFGFELLAGSIRSDHPNPERILRVIIEISRASGSEGIIDGFYREKEIVDQHSRFDFIEYLCRKKYGEMHACAAASGAILAGGAEEEIQKLRNFGHYAGTLIGLLHKKIDTPQIQNVIGKLKDLALKELEGFHGKNVELLCSLVADASLCEAELEV
uniref:Geranyl diphosphate synthase small subunit type I n=1 Tax=Salvia miltiorrhiza TaxID=226208 RepID=H6VLF4_SALMI|nr:geranyl diphosphate synthase small subunit type I [Salvia miltiorrhiza]